MRAATTIATLSLASLGCGWAMVLGYFFKGNTVAAFIEPTFRILLHLFLLGTALGFVAVVQAAMQKKDMPMAALAFASNLVCLVAPFVLVFFSLAG